MANRVPLDNVEHADLRVDSAFAAEYGHAVNQALLVPSEFVEAQREYPILFRQEKNGEFIAVALLGFDRGENLFLKDGQWRARHVPAAIRRGPFFLGSDHEVEPRLYVDLGDPRVGSAGEPLFRSHGGDAPYLDEVRKALRTVHQGLGDASAFFGALLDLQLIRPLELRIGVREGIEYHVPDVFSIDEDRWNALGGAELERLHRAGWLASVLLVRSSLGNVERLIALKAEREGRLAHD